MHDGISCAVQHSYRRLDTFHRDERMHCLKIHLRRQLPVSTTEAEGRLEPWSWDFKWASVQSQTKKPGILPYIVWQNVITRWPELIWARFWNQQRTKISWRRRLRENHTYLDQLWDHLRQYVLMILKVVAKKHTRRINIYKKINFERC